TRMVVLCASLPRTNATLPDGSAMAAWLYRACVRLPAGLQVEVCGSKISADESTAKGAPTGMPPATRTLPDSKSAAACDLRLVAMFGALDHEYSTGSKTSVYAGVV